MTWNKVPPYQDKIHQGCLNCPPVEEIAPMEMVIGVGFGYAAVTKDDLVIFNENDFLKINDHELDELPILQKFEDIALQDPDHDFRVQLEAPFRGRTYQRHDISKWVLIDSNNGFA